VEIAYPTPNNNHESFLASLSLAYFFSFFFFFFKLHFVSPNLSKLIELEKKSKYL